MRTGRCECGKVRFHFDHTISDFNACHCSQCRRLSGLFWAAFEVPEAQLIFDTEEGLRWYASSDQARRGFCSTCGASLFYRRNGSDVFEVAPGAMDGPLGTQISGHIFTADKGDYYDLTDGLPQYKAGM